MKIKQSSWFAASGEVQKALFLLSDGGFRLYFQLCLDADRRTGRVFLDYGELATKLKRSRGYIGKHFNELRTLSVCQVLSLAGNQHTHTVVEISDEFWPYSKEPQTENQSVWGNYRARIQALLSKRACIKCNFSATDEQFAAELFWSGVSLDQIERAIALACCRKYAGLLNGTDNEMIRRLSYFRDTLMEVQDPEAIHADLLQQRLLSVEHYEKRWLISMNNGADTRSAPATRSKSKKDEMKR